MMNLLWLVTFIFIGFFSLAGFSSGPDVHSEQSARQKERTSDDSRFNFNIYVENDTTNIGGPGTDSNYTNGVRFSFLYAQNKEPKWARAFPWLRPYFRDHSFNFGVGLGQNIYTPEDLKRYDVVSNDRPYAGWLYLSPTLTVTHEKSIDSYELDFGMIGAESFGRDAQTGFHKLIGAKLPHGWDHQLGTELGVLFSYQHKFELLELATRESNWTYLDILPYMGYGLGNVYDGTNTGMITRIGYNIPEDFGPSRPSSFAGDSFIKTEGPAKGFLQRNFSAYAFGGMKGDIILHNIFLDGSSFQDSPRVTRIPLVGEYELGLALQIQKVGITWRTVTRSAEYFDNYKSHSFASIGLSFGQRF
jgi:lipid A 3-O-deacylase